MALLGQCVNDSVKMEKLSKRKGSMKDIANNQACIIYGREVLIKIKNHSSFYMVFSFWKISIINLEAMCWIIVH